jgi:hypothetical protein
MPWPTWFSHTDKNAPTKRQGDGSKDKSAPEQRRGEAKRIWTLRKREFDKLRNLMQTQPLVDNKPQQKFFHTSMLTDLREKTSTIKKIDEIEAQMSMQWWKTEVISFSENAKA